jgi:hypothetical protein
MTSAQVTCRQYFGSALSAKGGQPPPAPKSAPWAGLSANQAWFLRHFLSLASAAKTHKMSPLIHFHHREGEIVALLRRVERTSSPIGL